MPKIKDIIYNYLVKKNENVRYEYERYVMENTVEHYEKRLMHWKILWKLNWHYRFKKEIIPLLFFDKNNRHKTKVIGVSEIQKSILKDSVENKIPVKTLVLNKAESEMYSRPSAISEARVYAKYDVISFDIFDTLIFRPFSKPSDLFMLVGEKLDIMDFSTIRIEAEVEARKQREMIYGNREITIYDIYRQISYKTGIDIERGVNVEFETEYELCFANPYMKRIYDLLYYGEKRIILVSDMYYPEIMLKKILEKCGYLNYEKLFISCEYNCSKSNVQLFRYVLDYVGNLQLIHIGDNVKSDVEIPRDLGIRSIHYQNVNERGRKYRPLEMSHLIGSAYRGIVNTYLHNGIKKYSPYFEYGFVYAGIYIQGYCCWIYNYAKTNNIEKILFLSRDGDIYYQIFNMLFQDLDSEYVYWSRIPTIKLTAENNRYPFIKSLIKDKARDLYQTKINKLFLEIGIESLLKYTEDYELKLDEYITILNEKMIEKLLCEHWEEVLKCFEKENEDMKQYYKKIVHKHKKIAVVDVGWSGNIVLGLKKLIEDKWKFDCKVDCLLAASRGLHETSLETQGLKQDVQSYMFSTIVNFDLHKRHMTTNKNLNSFLFEMLTQSNSPTFKGFNNKKFNFEIPETENFEHNKEVHEGIREFAFLYTNTFKNYKYMWQIPGRDAYFPFINLVKDLTFIKEYFSDYVFGRGVLSTSEEEGKETVKQVLENKKL